MVAVRKDLADGQFFPLLTTVADQHHGHFTRLLIGLRDHPRPDAVHRPRRALLLVAARGHERHRAEFRRRHAARLVISQWSCASVYAFSPKRVFFAISLHL